MEEVGGGGTEEEVEEDGGHTEDTRQRVQVLAVVVTVSVEVVRGKKILGFLTLKGEGVRLSDWEHSGRARQGKKRTNSNHGLFRQFQTVKTDSESIRESVYCSCRPLQTCLFLSVQGKAYDVP